jgi:hypothetical protein
MSIPVLQNGPYIFNTNNADTETDVTAKRKKVIWGIKECIIGLGGVGTIWQVVASSDASSVKNIGDADPDLWVTYENVKNTIYGTSRNSWVVLENLTNGMQICIDYNSSYLYWQRVDIFVSLGGTYSTNGTNANRPSCSDEKTLWTGSFDQQSNQYDSFSIHGMTSANHETLRVFYVAEHDTTAGSYFSKAILIEEVTNAPDEWISDPKYLVLTAPTINVSTSPSQQSPRFQDVSHKWDAYLETTEPYAGWVTCYETTECYDLISSSQGRVLCNNAVSHDSLGGRPLSVIGLFSNDATRGGSYGRLQDIYFGTTADAMYSTYPADNSRQWIKFGCLVVPWDGSDPAGGTARDAGVSDNFTVTTSGNVGRVRSVPKLVRALD